MLSVFNPLVSNNNQTESDKAKQSPNTHIEEKMIGGIYDLTELQHELEEARGNIRVKPRTASLFDDAHKLLEEGYTIKHVAKMMRVHESTIAKYEEGKRIFLSTGKLPEEHRTYSFIQGKSMTTYY